MASAWYISPACDFSTIAVSGAVVSSQYLWILSAILSALMTSLGIEVAISQSS